jgi:hypothetical protein
MRSATVGEMGLVPELTRRAGLRGHVVLSSAVVFALSFGVWTLGVVAEDRPAGSGESAKGLFTPAPDNEIVFEPDDSRLPKIPLQVYATGVASRASRNDQSLDLKLTAAQQRACDALIADYTNMSGVLSQVQQTYLPNGPASGTLHRFSLALSKERDDLDDASELALERLLTKRQREVLRMKFREEIRNHTRARAMRRVHDPEPSLVQGENRRAPDYLTQLRNPQTQVLLKVNDSQLLHLEELHVEAVEEMRELVRQVVATSPGTSAQGPSLTGRNMPVPRPDPGRIEAYRRLDELVAQVLTAEQIETAKKFSKRQVFPFAHGDITGFQERRQNDQIKITLNVFNLFEAEALVDELMLTDAQRKTLTDQLDSWRQSEEHRIASELATAAKARQRVAQDGQALIDAHAQAWNASVLRVLTPEQVELLETAQWRSLGLRAIADPEFHNRLALSEEQRLRLVPLIKPASGSEVEFQAIDPKLNPEQQLARLREMQAASQKFVEEQRMRLEKALEVLTPEQRVQFTKLTGYQSRQGTRNR